MLSRCTSLLFVLSASRADDNLSALLSQIQAQSSSQGALGANAAAKPPDVSSNSASSAVPISAPIAAPPSLNPLDSLMNLGNTSALTQNLAGLAGLGANPAVAIANLMNQGALLPNVSALPALNMSGLLSQAGHLGSTFQELAGLSNTANGLVGAVAGGTPLGQQAQEILNMASAVSGIGGSVAGLVNTTHTLLPDIAHPGKLLQNVQNATGISGLLGPTTGSPSANGTVADNLVKAFITNGYLNQAGQNAMRLSGLAIQAAQFQDLADALSGAAPAVDAAGRLTPAVQRALREMGVSVSTPEELVMHAMQQGFAVQRRRLESEPALREAILNFNNALGAIIRDPETRRLQAVYGMLPYGRPPMYPSPMGVPRGAYDAYPPLPTGRLQSRTMYEAPPSYYAGPIAPPDYHVSSGDMYGGVPGASRPSRPEYDALEQVAARHFGGVSDSGHLQPRPAPSRRLQSWLNDTLGALVSILDDERPEWKSDVQNAANELANQFEQISQSLRSGDLPDRLQSFWSDISARAAEITASRTSTTAPSSAQERRLSEASSHHQLQQMGLPLVSSLTPFMNLASPFLSPFGLPNLNAPLPLSTTGIPGLGLKRQLMVNATALPSGATPRSFAFNGSEPSVVISPEGGEPVSNLAASLNENRNLQTAGSALDVSSLTALLPSLSGTTDVTAALQSLLKSIPQTAGIQTLPAASAPSLIPTLPTNPDPAALLTAITSSSETVLPPTGSALPAGTDLGILLGGIPGAGILPTNISPDVSVILNAVQSLTGNVNPIGAALPLSNSLDMSAFTHSLNNLLNQQRRRLQAWNAPPYVPWADYSSLYTYNPYLVPYQAGGPWFETLQPLNTLGGLLQNSLGTQSQDRNGKLGRTREVGESQPTRRLGEETPLSAAAIEERLHEQSTRNAASDSDVPSSASTDNGAISEAVHALHKVQESANLQGFLNLLHSETASSAEIAEAVSAGVPAGLSSADLKTLSEKLGVPIESTLSDILDVSSYAGNVTPGISSETLSSLVKPLESLLAGMGSGLGLDNLMSAFGSLINNNTASSVNGTHLLGVEAANISTSTFDLPGHHSHIGNTSAANGTDASITSAYHGSSTPLNLTDESAALNVPLVSDLNSLLHSPPTLPALSVPSLAPNVPNINALFGIDSPANASHNLNAAAPDINALFGLGSPANMSHNLNATAPDINALFGLGSPANAAHNLNATTPSSLLPPNLSMTGSSDLDQLLGIGNSPMNLSGLFGASIPVPEVNISSLLPQANALLPLPHAPQAEVSQNAAAVPSSVPQLPGLAVPTLPPTLNNLEGLLASLMVGGSPDSNIAVLPSPGSPSPSPLWPPQSPLAPSPFPGSVRLRRLNVDFSESEKQALIASLAEPAVRNRLGELVNQNQIAEPLKSNIRAVLEQEQARTLQSTNTYGLTPEQFSQMQGVMGHEPSAWLAKLRSLETAGVPLSQIRVGFDKEGHPIMTSDGIDLGVLKGRLEDSKTGKETAKEMLGVDSLGSALANGGIDLNALVHNVTQARLDLNGILRMMDLTQVDVNELVRGLEQARQSEAEILSNILNGASGEGIDYQSLSQAIQMLESVNPMLGLSALANNADIRHALSVLNLTDMSPLIGSNPLALFQPKLPGLTRRLSEIVDEVKTKAGALEAARFLEQLLAEQKALHHPQQQTLILQSAGLDPHKSVALAASRETKRRLESLSLGSRAAETTASQSSGGRDVDLRFDGTVSFHEDHEGSGKFIAATPDLGFSWTFDESASMMPPLLACWHVDGQAETPDSWPAFILQSASLDILDKQSGEVLRSLDLSRPESENVFEYYAPGWNVTQSWLQRRNASCAWIPMCVLMEQLSQLRSSGVLSAVISLVADKVPPTRDLQIRDARVVVRAVAAEGVWEDVAEGAQLPGGAVLSPPIASISQVFANSPVFAFELPKPTDSNAVQSSGISGYAVLASAESTGLTFVFGESDWRWIPESAHPAYARILDQLKSFDERFTGDRNEDVAANPDDDESDYEANAVTFFNAKRDLPIRVNEWTYLPRFVLETTAYAGGSSPRKFVVQKCLSLNAMSSAVDPLAATVFDMLYSNGGALESSVQMKTFMEAAPVQSMVSSSEGMSVFDMRGSLIEDYSAASWSVNVTLSKIYPAMRGTERECTGGSDCDLWQF
eukprot:Gregarina_sp_Poly_1__4462@NODE_23_length_20322_cov_242_373192_g21_i0_p1_GENE_NODE_23_length_20322_cov_242_373192_g21_i0NODE_23_length_20322_cov_242_373192_g21_i0_p1_ORF_typecomplete_len2162_score352_74OSCP/PF00213_18/1_1e04OSCP/PF00213_18/2_9OSCP/PF00213_18/1_3e03OSCP/PF00213_18/4_9e03_NODE_23_length_20322_cov_242_373192_g21_i01022616711